MAELWYYYEGGTKVGPLSPDQLLAAAGAGKFSSGDRVWSSSMEESVLAAEVPELAGALEAGTAQAPADEPDATAAVAGGGRAGRFQERVKQAITGDDRQTTSSRKKRSEVAQVPSTVLTVEYVDGSEGMDAALKAIEQRLARLEQLAREVQETVSQLVTAVNRQEKNAELSMESLARRMDSVFSQMRGSPAATDVMSAGIDALDVGKDASGFPPQFNDNEEHQKAWQMAQVMTADLEAYHGDQVREGVLYDNLTQVLEGPIGEARSTYQERVSERVREEFDYFQLALQRLIARKKRDLASEESPQ